MQSSASDCVLLMVTGVLMVGFDVFVLRWPKLHLSQAVWEELHHNKLPILKDQEIEIMFNMSRG